MVLIRLVILGLATFCVAAIGYLFLLADAPVEEDGEAVENPIVLRYAGREDKLVLAASIVPELQPHEHEPGESIYDPDHHILTSSDTIVADQDIYVRGFEYVVEGAPFSTLHHAILSRLDERDPVCQNFFRQFYLAGSDTVTFPTIALPDGYAFYLPKGTPLTFEAMLHNPTPPVGPGGFYENIRAAVILDILPSDTNGLKSVEVFRLHVQDIPCHDAPSATVFRVPANSKHFVAKGQQTLTDHPAWHRFEETGTIVLMVAHIHAWEGGEELRVLLNDTEIETFVPRLTTDEPWSYQTPAKEVVIPVERGDILSIEAVYSNPNPVPLTGAMGMLGIVFAPTKTEP